MFRVLNIAQFLANNMPFSDCRCKFDGCTYQSHFSENVNKHFKRMHSNIRPKQKKRLAAAASKAAKSSSSTLLPIYGGQPNYNYNGEETQPELSSHQIMPSQQVQTSQQPSAIPMSYYCSMQTGSNYHTIVLSDMKSCQPAANIAVKTAQEVESSNLLHKATSSTMPSPDMLRLGAAQSTSSDNMYNCNQFNTADLANHSRNYISL